MGSSAKAGQSKAAIQVYLWLALAIAYFGAVLLQAPRIYDEGLIVCGAERVAHGQIPYRDFFTGYPPAQFYTIAAVFRAFGTTLFAERVWDTAWRMAIVGLVCALLGRASGRRPHPLPMICIGIFTGATGYYLYPMIDGTLFSVAALLCATQYLNGRDIKWLWFSGLAVGAGALYRHDLLFCVSAAVAITGTWQSIAEWKVAEWKGRWPKAPGVFVAGVLLVLTPLVLVMWSAVPRDALRQAFFEFPAINGAARRMPLPAPSIPAFCDFYLPLAIVAVSAARLRWTPAAARPVLVLWLLSSGLTLGLATQRLDAVHTYPAVLFALVLLSLQLPGPGSGNQNLLPSVCRGAALCGVIFFYGIVPLVRWSLEVAEVMRIPASGIVRAGPVRLEPDQREAIEYIQQHLPAGQPLYVGTATHGLAYFNDALFYFLADRPQVTRFDMFLPGVTNVAGGQAGIARNIEEKRVKYVVLFAAPLSKERNASSVDSGITLLDDAIHQDYTEVACFNRYAIWQRRKP